METQITSTKTVRRNPYLAALLSFIMPGLGSIYTGQLKKGLIVYAFFVFGFFICFRLIGLYAYFNTLVLTVIIALAVRLYEICNVFIDTRKQKNYTLKSYNTWYVYIGLVFMCYVVIFTIPFVFERLNFGTHMFTISSPSMEPTLRTGDHIVVSLSAQPESFKRGDIVTFRPDPSQPTVWVSRVVAMPGDTFSVKNDFLIINNKQHRVKSLPDRIVEVEPTISAPHLTFEETLLNGKLITIHKYKNTVGAIPDIPLVVVPHDSVVMISDNRDNAFDSRYLGFVPKASIQGKVLYTWWSKKLNRIGIDLTSR